MKRLTICGIIVCVGLLVGSAAVIGAPAGPPSGLDVNVVSPDPLPVAGDVNVVNEPGVTVLNNDTNPVPVTVQTVYRFAEFSTTETNGGTGGIGGMHFICQTDLNDTSARMCTTKELILSPNIPAAGAVSAWVQPEIVTTVIDSGVLRHCDYSGLCFNRDIANCVQWVRSDAGARGIFFNGTLGAIVSSLSCDNTLRVACCTPTN